MDTKKFNALKNIKKRDVIVVSTIVLVSLPSAFLIPNPQELVSSDTLKYLGSALIQSFAALIAIPFAFYSSYLHNRYGYPGLQFAISRVKKHIFPPFALVGVLSVTLIVFPNYPNLPMIEFSEDFVLRCILFGEFITSGILLYVIYLHLIEVMTVTPLKLAQEIIEKEENKSDYVPVGDMVDKFKMVSELLIISLKDTTLHRDSEDILKQLLKLLEKYQPNEDLEISDEIITFNQVFEVLNFIITTLEDTGPIISRDSIKDLVETLSKIYTNFLIRHHLESFDINQDEMVLERTHRLHGAFYDVITKLSMLYSMNFYKVYYNTFRKHSISQTSSLIEPISTLIEKTLTYLRRAIYLDQEDTIPWASRTLVAVSGIDFIFDLLSRLEEKELKQLLISSKKELIEIIQEIKLLLFHPTQTYVVSYPVIPRERKPIYIDDKNVILNVLSAWTRCILTMTEKIAEYDQNKQNLDHAPAVGSSKEVSDQIQETEKHLTEQAKQLKEVFEPLDKISKQFQKITKSLNLTPKIPRLVPELSKNINHTEWILKEILIKNIVELYEEFECALIFEPESKIVVLRAKKLGIWHNIGLASEKFNEIYDYLQDTKLQKYLRWEEKTNGVHRKEEGLA